MELWWFPGRWYVWFSWVVLCFILVPSATKTPFKDAKSGVLRGWPIHIQFIFWKCELSLSVFQMFTQFFGAGLPSPFYIRLGKDNLYCSLIGLQVQKFSKPSAGKRKCQSLHFASILNIYDWCSWSCTLLPAWARGHFLLWMLCSCSFQSLLYCLVRRWWCWNYEEVAVLVQPARRCLTPIVGKGELKPLSSFPHFGLVLNPEELNILLKTVSN